MAAKYIRKHFNAEELSTSAQRQITWPLWSIFLLCSITGALPAGLTSGMLIYFCLLAWLITWGAKKPIPEGIIGPLSPFAVLIVIGVMGGQWGYTYLKDAWYFLNPIFNIVTGIILARCISNIGLGLRAFVLAGTAAALQHLLWFVIHPELLSFKATSVREIAGLGSPATTLALIILAGSIHSSKALISTPKLIAGAALLVTAASTMLSYSRTSLLIFIIGLLSVLGWFRLKHLPKILLSVSLFISVIYTVGTISEQSAIHDPKSFIGKLLNSVNEVSLGDFRTTKQINDNWRGYETQQAIKTWKSGHDIQLLFGQGFGKEVDLEFFQRLGGNEREKFRFIPVTHNGYAMLLVKTGVIGIIVYTLPFIWMVILGARFLDHPDPQIKLCARLLQSIGLITLATTAVISGALNKFALISQILAAGYLLGTLYDAKKTQRVIPPPAAKPMMPGTVLHLA